MSVPATNPAPVVSVVVVSFNTRELLRECLRSVSEHLASLPHETLVVDNASSDGSAEMVAAEFPSVHLLRNTANEGFGRANNRAMREARGRIFLLLNSDARLVDTSLLGLVADLQAHPDIGVVGPRLRRPDGSTQPSAYRFGSLRLIALEELGLYKLWSPARRAELLLGGYWDHSGRRPADWLVGACLLVRREVFDAIGGFDPGIFLYGEEEEWCGRIRAAGWGVVFDPAGQVVHVGHASSASSLGEERRVRRCLAASDALVLRREGRIAAFLLRGVRLLGALEKLVFLGARSRIRRGDARTREALWTSRLVLRSYLLPGRREE